MIIRLAAIAALLALPSAASAEAFAIECSGSRTWTDTITIRKLTGTTPLKREVFVIDPDKSEVRHLLYGGREYEDTCVFKQDCVVTVGTNVVNVSAFKRDSDSMYSVDLTIYRTDGKLTKDIDTDLDDGRYRHEHTDMTCSKTDVPVFEKALNKF